MHLSRLTVLSSLLLLFTDSGVAEGFSCYSEGQTWDNVATGDLLVSAFNQLCGFINGTHDVGTWLKECHNVVNNNIYTTFNIKRGPSGSSGVVKISTKTCVSLLTAVKNECPKYGGHRFHTAGPADDGGDYIEAVVRADPNTGKSIACDAPNHGNSHFYD
ncbi:hypothetical protein Daus18300_009828 [Diaporthe australafricana]|uniref:Secreted protein n=1 Tax=Diaporthe australafricana TaxID=127596 RepID=A0ABR3WCK7_9PEZI